ncbi:MAG: SCP2 sterol-binding domain-containing protein [Gammaproteobacteria bacterium]|nr:SCP2 sterol-binding domain-containing protein [Gammaproteobacteria bacterium]
MDVLETTLRPVARILNRNIAESTPARELCEQLSGAVVAIRVRNTALAAFFIVADDALDVVSTTSQEPDVVITGSLLTLAGMAGNSGAAAIRAGSLDLTGDASLAAQFQRLLLLARPDMEEELSNLVGDLAAHRLGEFARGVGRWGREARSTMSANIREYLQEESRDTPSRYEVEKFGAAVNTLRDDVDRVEARLNRLQRGT